MKNTSLESTIFSRGEVTQHGSRGDVEPLLFARRSDYWQRDIDTVEATKTVRWLVSTRFSTRYDGPPDRDSGGAHRRVASDQTKPLYARGRFSR